MKESMLIANAPLFYLDFYGGITLMEEKNATRKARGKVRTRGLSGESRMIPSVIRISLFLSSIRQRRERSPIQIG